ncbi:hypothetical protein DV737_g3106, partial [Chaetothyriales sp. CBS 132003]
MLWNWYTVDACFLTPSWHVHSRREFAASCIGVIVLVVSLEVLRRVGKAYDQQLLAQFHRLAARRVVNPSAENSQWTGENASHLFRYTPLQQLVRSVIHMATFAVAYLIMLLAMYFNGYIIISIFIGALLGKFVCDWETINIPLARGDGAEDSQEQPKADQQELTYCCESGPDSGAPAGKSSSATIARAGSPPGGPRSAIRRRAAADHKESVKNARPSSTRAAGAGGSSGTMLRLYTDESPGLRVDPMVIMFLSLGFIFSVVALHRVG